MRTIASSPASHVLVEAGQRVVVRAGHLLNRLIAIRRGRRALDELAEMDATMLADIGLTRDDVIAAIRSPLERDPTERLAAAVRRRA